MKHQNSPHAGIAQPSVAECAAEWLVALKDSSASRADKESFVAWLKRSPVHVEEFLRVSTLDAALSGRDFGVEVDGLIAEGRSLVAAGDAVRELKIPVSWPARNEDATRRPLRYAALAACALIVSIAAVLWWVLQPYATYATERGEQRAVSLPDGSLMELNTDTRVRVAYTEDRRQIVLVRGEAMFTVAGNPRRPFVVNAGARSIRALGTRFSVSERSTRVVVTVVEGSVAVLSSNATGGSKGTAAVGLSAGQQFDSTVPAPTRVRAVDIARATAWQQWKLYFDDVSLNEAVAEFNRYNREQLRIADPDLAGRRISGVFFANQPDSLLAFIGERDAVEVVEGRGGTRIVRLK